MTILDKIIKNKTLEIAHKKKTTSILDFQESKHYKITGVSMVNTLREKRGIIAEFKRKSPSKGIINQSVNLTEVIKGYEKAGVSGISCLTDVDFFGATLTDFQEARIATKVPLLRKEFIIDDYQIHESKAMGADVILLIAGVLDCFQINDFVSLAHELNMEVLLETHTEAEVLDHLSTKANMVGINNRDLNTFEVSVENSIRLANLLPESILKIAESGIDSFETIKRLRSNGFEGFLIGEYFMKSTNPAEKCKQLIKLLEDEN